MVYYGSQGLPQPNPLLEAIGILSGFDFVVPRRGCWVVEILEESNAGIINLSGTGQGSELTCLLKVPKWGEGQTLTFSRWKLLHRLRHRSMIPLGGCQRICGMDTLRRRGCPGRAWFPWLEQSCFLGASIYEVNMDGSASLDHFFLMGLSENVGYIPNEIAI